MSADALAKGAGGVGRTREKGKKKFEGWPWSWLVETAGRFLYLGEILLSH